MLHDEIGGPDVNSEQFVEVLDCHVLEGRRLRNPCVGHKDVEPIANQVANLRGEDVGAVGCGEIGCDGIRTSASRANLIDYGSGFVGIAAVVDDDAGAGGGECQGGGAAHSAGRAGDESGLIGEACHDGILLCDRVRGVWLARATAANPGVG